MAGFRKWPILATILLIGITAQSQKIFFEQLTTAEGLPSDYVNCVFEDSKGYLWIGTDKGACRFDGKQFQYFSDDNGLPSNFISCFAEDLSGNIWIGTVDAGVCIFDGSKLERFLIQSYKTAHITDIEFNPDNSFFITSSSFGLFYFENAKAVPRFFKDFSFIRKIAENRFLSGISQQLYILEKKGNELKLLPQPYPVEHGNLFVWLSDDDIIGLGDSSIQSYSISGHTWVTKNKFTVKRIMDWGDFKKVFINNIDAYPQHGELGWRDIKKVFINNNELFMATSDGLIYVDSDEKQYHFTDQNGLGTNFLKSFYKDRKNNIYLCTYGGGIKIWPAGYLSEFIINGKVTSIFPTANEIYITTNKSVYQYQVTEKKLTGITIPAAGNFTGIYREQNGSIYLGTLNNFYRFPAGKFQSKSIINDIAKYSHIANSGISGFASQKNNMFISTYGEGIYILDHINNTIDTLSDTTKIPAPRIVESLVPLETSIAALTYNSGMVIYDSLNNYINLTRSQGLLSNTVYSAFKDKENFIWIGTKNGLNLFDGKKIISTYSVNEGLIGTNVLCIFQDKQHRLWMLSDKYLHQIDGRKLRAIRSHPILYDQKNSINRAVYSKDHNALFIGLTDALLIVDMNKILIDTVVSTPRLSAVRKDTAMLAFTPAELLSISNPASRINFEFINPYHSFTHQHDLYYKLKGFDDNWKFLSSTNEISYQKLAPGKYELLAKTINPDGYASPEISLLSLEVLPPLWKRTWFIIIMSIVVLAAFFYVGHILSRRRYKRKLSHLQEEYLLQLERERIARELHDNVGSQLTYLINKIDDDYPKLAEKNEAEKLSGFARGAMQELRETIWALDKKEVQWDDLENKIRQLLLLYRTEKHDVELEWQINGHQPPLNPLEALNIYRIIQEALNNAEKYSNANNVKVSAHLDNNKVCVEITDNGKGFDNEKIEKGYGLRNMKKRAEEMNAGLHIESEPDKGTTVKLFL